MSESFQDLRNVISRKKNNIGVHNIFENMFITLSPELVVDAWKVYVLGERFSRLLQRALLFRLNQLRHIESKLAAYETQL